MSISPGHLVIILLLFGVNHYVYANITPYFAARSSGSSLISFFDIDESVYPPQVYWNQQYRDPNQDQTIDEVWSVPSDNSEEATLLYSFRTQGDVEESVSSFCATRGGVFVLYKPGIMGSELWHVTESGGATLVDATYRPSNAYAFSPLSDTVVFVAFQMTMDSYFLLQSDFPPTGTMQVLKQLTSRTDESDQKRVNVGDNTAGFTYFPLDHIAKTENYYFVFGFNMVSDETMADNQVVFGRWDDTSNVQFCDIFDDKFVDGFAVDADNDIVVVTAFSKDDLIPYLLMIANGNCHVVQKYDVGHMQPLVTTVKQKPNGNIEIVAAVRDDDLKNQTLVLYVLDESGNEVRPEEVIFAVEEEYDIYELGSFEDYWLVAYREVVGRQHLVISIKGDGSITNITSVELFPTFFFDPLISIEIRNDFFTFSFVSMTQAEVIGGYSIDSVMPIDSTPFEGEPLIPSVRIASGRNIFALLGSAGQSDVYQQNIFGYNASQIVVPTSAPTTSVPPTSTPTASTPPPSNPPTSAPPSMASTTQSPSRSPFSVLCDGGSITSDDCACTTDVCQCYNPNGDCDCRSSTHCSGSTSQNAYGGSNGIFAASWVNNGEVFCGSVESCICSPMDFSSTQGRCHRQQARYFLCWAPDPERQCIEG
mmetsp:Transcript_23728/g.26316  ORF Transcript_23728/g.26316 Transcript_23728/m.26316 type:complete len:649 (+) Transcript_23728:2-1948(+)